MAGEVSVETTVPSDAQRVRSWDPVETTLFKEWLIAKERVQRRNRNALQYAAGLAALLGIGGATTSVLALANSLGEMPVSVGAIAYVALLIGCGLAVVLGVLLVKSLGGRRRAEKEVDERLRQLPVDLVAPAQRSEPTPA